MKPKIGNRYSISEVVALHRSRRFLDERGMVAILRKTSPLGPVFVIDEGTEHVIAKNIRNYRELAAHFGLLLPQARAVHTLTCAHCRAKFETGSAQAIYCSASCRVTACQKRTRLRLKEAA